MKSFRRGVASVQAVHWVCQTQAKGFKLMRCRRTKCQERRQWSWMPRCVSDARGRGELLSEATKIITSDRVLELGEANETIRWCLGPCEG